MATAKKEVKPIVKVDTVKVSSHIKKMVVEGSQLLKQSEKAFVDVAVERHYATLKREQPLIDKMKETGLI